MAREMKNSGVEWFGEIPIKWRVEKIDAQFSLRTQKVNDVDFPPLSVTKKGILPQLENVAKTNAHDSRKLVKIGDFAINSRSDRRGSCGISEYEGSVSLINTVLKPNSNNISKYLDWLFHTIEFADEFYRWGHGIVDDLWTTNWSDMKKISIPIPPLEEQKDISNFLDKKCSEIDSLTADIEKQISLLEDYKKSIITGAVTKGLNPNVEFKDSGIEWIGKIPKHWEITKIKNLGNARNGLTYSPSNLCDENSGTLVLRSSNIKNGKLSFDDNVFVNCLIKNNLKVKKGDILICSRNGSAKLIGKSALIDRDLNSSFGAFMMIFRSKLNTRYIKYILESDVFKFNLSSYLTSTINQLTNQNFSNMKIVFCNSEKEQKEIVDFLDKKCSEIDSLISDKKEQLEKLASYKQSMIYEYVTGKKEVPAQEIA